MLSGSERLLKDLKIIELMTAELSAYLDSDTLFGPTMYPEWPPVTLGGFLMRRHRLLALRDTLLPPAEQSKLDELLTTFDLLLQEKRFQFQEKARREGEVRIHQWEQHLNEMAEQGHRSAAYYATLVEPRVMVADIFRELYSLANPPEPYLAQQVEAPDNQLRRYWQSGKFVWPLEWQPAYPQSKYWWLYGQPQFSQGGS